MPDGSGPSRPGGCWPHKTKVRSLTYPTILNMKKILIAMCLMCMTQVEALAMCGVSSWYGPGFHGRQTASGERFNKNDLTAAHKTLKFGTRVKVTNPKNGKTVVVRINDRGPFIKGRVLDLSEKAASMIGIKSRGVAKVCLKIE